MDQVSYPVSGYTLRAPEKSSIVSPVRIPLAVTTILAIGATLAAVICVQANVDIDIVIDGINVSSDGLIVFGAVTASAVGVVTFASFFVHHRANTAEKLQDRNLVAYYSGLSAHGLKRENPAKVMEAIRYCIQLTDKEETTDNDRANIHKFFQVFIHAIKNRNISIKEKASNSFYNKMVRARYEPKTLFSNKVHLQQIIAPDTIPENLADNATPKEVAEADLRNKYWKGILAGDLNGNRYLPVGEGVNGTLFFYSLEGEKLGVFKPHPKTMRDQVSIFHFGQFKERCKSVVGMAAYLNKRDRDRRVHNELFAYELFHAFGFADLGVQLEFPTTQIFQNPPIQVGNKRPASFCAFLEGVDAVKDHVEDVDGKDNILDEDREYSEEELTIWQLSKVFDFLTGNLDGHEGNAFVRVNEQGILVGAANFDYDKAFIALNPMNPPDNQYKWAKLKISECPFTEQTIEKLKKVLVGKKGKNKVSTLIQKFLLAIGENPENPGTNFVLAQQDLLLDRISVLQLVALGQIETLADLRNYRTTEALSKADEDAKKALPKTKRMKRKGSLSE